MARSACTGSGGTASGYGGGHGGGASWMRRAICPWCKRLIGVSGQGRYRRHVPYDKRTHNKMQEIVCAILPSVQTEQCTLTQKENSDG
jgi:hypothetical protein